MAVTVSMGIPGLDEIGPGTHMCALYSSPAERDRLLFPFLCGGIREGRGDLPEGGEVFVDIVDGELTVIPCSGPPEEREAV